MGFKIFVFVMAIAWAVGGVIATVALYYDPGSHASLFTPSHQAIFGRFIAGWAGTGGLMGITTMIIFRSLASKYEPAEAYGKHLVPISLAAVFWGAGLALVLYKIIDPAQGAIPRPIEWAIPICVGVAFIATHVGSNVIGWVSRQL